MIIQTVKKTYLVIGYLEQDGQKEICLCENTVDRSRCLIIRIKDQQLILAAVEFLYEQVANEAFSDFQDCFVSEESLLLVFSCYEGQDLEQKIQSEYSSLEERLEIIKKILERIILMGMPLYFASHCMELKNVFVSRSLHVSFRYEITDMGQSRLYSMIEVQSRLRKLMEFVFQDELKKEVIKPVADFQDALESRLYDGYLELYRGFLHTREQVLALSKQDMEIPKTWLFRMWERIRKLLKPLKKIIVIGILAAGLLYMLWTIDYASKPASSARIVDQIGTLKLE